MKTREEKIAELSEGDQVALEHYELHPKHNPWGNPNDPISKLWELGKKIAESVAKEISNTQQKKSDQ